MQVTLSSGNVSVVAVVLWLGECPVCALTLSGWVCPMLVTLWLLCAFQGTAATNNISATPTFLFFRNKVRIDQYQGADAVGLEEKIKQHLENDPGNSEDTDIPKGYVCTSS